MFSLVMFLWNESVLLLVGSSLKNFIGVILWLSRFCLILVQFRTIDKRTKNSTSARRSPQHKRIMYCSRYQYSTLSKHPCKKWNQKLWTNQIKIYLKYLGMTTFLKIARFDWLAKSFIDRYWIKIRIHFKFVHQCTARQWHCQFLLSELL